MAARRRVGGYADALLEDLDTSRLRPIEEELFRWARTIEANRDLRRLLLDRDAAARRRASARSTQLLAGRVTATTLRLARFVIEGGRPRDVVGTLDFLVDYVARARDWRVARVHTARPLDAASRAQLVASLHHAHRQERRTAGRRGARPCWAASSSRSATCASTPPRGDASGRCATPWPRATCSNPP